VIVNVYDHPALLLPRGKYNDADPFENFSRGKALAAVCRDCSRCIKCFCLLTGYSQAYKSIFVLPSAATASTDKATRAGNAAKNNVEFVTLEAVAYVAVLVSVDLLSSALANAAQVRFALLTQQTFAPGGPKPKGNTWVFQRLYFEVLHIFNNFKDDDRKDLEEWWNKCIPQPFSLSCAR
jgi:hypothetical protein